MADADSASTFQVVLIAAGDRKIQAIKAVRSATGFGLKEAKEFVDGAPSVVGGLQREQAEALIRDLEKAGAQAQVQEGDHAASVDARLIGSGYDLEAWVQESLEPEERLEAIIQTANFWGRGSNRYVVFTSERLLVIERGEEPPKRPDWIPYRGVTGFSGAWIWPFSTSIELDLFGRKNELKLDFQSEDDHYRALQLLRQYAFREPSA